MKKEYKLLKLPFLIAILFIGCNSTQETKSEESEETDTVVSMDSPNFVQEKYLKIPYSTSDDGFVNLRSKPSNEGEILSQVTFGGYGVILGTEDDWFKINAGPNTGYCYSKYIGYYSWYDGTGDKRLVAIKDCPVYPGYAEVQVDPIGIVPAGTIIGDKFEEYDGDYLFILDEGDSYHLNTAFDNDWRIKKEFVRLESCTPTVARKPKVQSDSYQNSSSSYNTEASWDWLEGTWTWSGTIGGYRATAKLVVSDGYATMYGDGDVLDRGSFSVYGSQIKFGSSYVDIDASRHVVYVDKSRGLEFKKGNYTTSSYSDQSTFNCSDDVYRYLSSHTFYIDGDRMQFARGGVVMVVNGNPISNALVIDRFDSYTATLHYTSPYGMGVNHIYVNLSSGTIREGSGDIWRTR